MSELGADHLLIMHTAGINQREQLEQTGIWGTLDPVRNDNVYWFDNETYYDLSFGANGKLILLEQLEKQLLKYDYYYLYDAGIVDRNRRGLTKPLECVQEG